MVALGQRRRQALVDQLEVLGLLSSSNCPVSGGWSADADGFDLDGLSARICAEWPAGELLIARNKLAATAT